ncbi:hypothetical protein [Pseudomonas helleri]|uniref:Fis family transcriptional regulator n=1 Tax=Pseudomonas helleri TaxID=1608996 RepID=A0A6L5HVK2_9PSED|nr:hypothetical protein [Pseudomonas helleri]MQU07434.1 hypothetical protein [Pseudomonas helleri]
MSLNKRNQAQIERRLVKHLTDACETAKGQIPGFVWLTHSVDFEAFPASLKVVWVFDNQVNKDFALADGEARFMVELTTSALLDANIKVRQVANHVFYDSEDECQRACGGDWVKRLAQKTTRK